MNDNKDKVVLITGASQGIGRGIAVHLARVGYGRLVLVARRKAELEETAALCLEAGAREAAVLIKDLTSSEQCAEAVEEAAAKMGRLDVLIGNAGKGALKSVREETAEDFRHYFDLNVTANFVLTKHALPHLEKTKGNIVFISSISGEMCAEKLATYSSSKAALDHFARCVALEEAPRGIRVNVVSPGITVVENRYKRAGLDQNKQEDRQVLRDSLRHWQPLGRAGEIEEVAKVVEFVMGEGASFMTGSSLRVDGGAVLAGMPKEK